MNMKLQLAAIALALTTLNSELSTAFAQGSLTPPGAPATTMRTLDQIYARTDSRIPITNSASAVTIAAPGSYYLTTNLTVSSGDAITIAASGVTLDLNGYTIRSTTAFPTGSGIRLNFVQRNITIANGFIESGVTNNGSGVYSGSGFVAGISYSGNAPVNVLVSRVSVAGCLNYGINLNTSDSTVVESCTVRTVGSLGIFASTIKQSSATDCGSTAIRGDQVSDCRGESSGNGNGDGVSATTALNCYGSSSSSGTGVYAQTANNCYGHNTGNGYGVSALTAQNCYGQNIGNGYGLYATTANHCIGVNFGSGYGIYAEKIAFGCNGESDGGIGLNTYNAAFCTASRPGGTALLAIIANGCIVTSGSSGITYKYNMP